MEETNIMARVLIVDDAKFIRMTLKNILKKHDYDIVGEAKNGVEAVRLYEEYQPDLVLMDITMPLMNGVEATKQIMKQNKQAKIIICSAMGQHKVIVSAIEAGALDFIIKPFDENRVLETLHHVL